MKNGVKQAFGISIATFWSMGILISAFANPQDRLYIKELSSGRIAAAMDPAGNFYTYAEKGYDVASPSSGLVFKKNGQTVVAITEAGSDPTQFGKVHSAFAAYENSPVPYHPSGTLVFKYAGTAKVDFDHVDGSINMTGQYGEKFGYRKNAAYLRPCDRQNFVDAILWLDTKFLPGSPGPSNVIPVDPHAVQGISYWDKLAQIHKTFPQHGTAAFLPWHREFINRLEDSLRLYDQLVSLPYWDWTSDPAVPSGYDGVPLIGNAIPRGWMGSGVDQVGFPFTSLANSGNYWGSRREAGNPFYPPESLIRNTRYGLPTDYPGIDFDQNILANFTYETFSVALEGNAHNTAHDYIGGGMGGNMSDLSKSPEDPFFFLLHTNCDRIWAKWQNDPAYPGRLNPNTVYGTYSQNWPNNWPIPSTFINPWAGGSASNLETPPLITPMSPWYAPNSEIKSYLDLSTVIPRLYAE